MGSGGRYESNGDQLTGIGDKKIFHELDEHHVYKVGIHRFSAQEAEMSLTAMSFALIDKKKNFHELDVHHVKKVRIKRFCAQKAEMSRTAMSSLESARRKFFMNSTYIMSRK